MKEREGGREGGQGVMERLWKEGKAKLQISVRTQAVSSAFRSHSMSSVCPSGYVAEQEQDLRASSLGGVVC